MKNKNFICILIFLAFVANISKSSELDITSKIIKVEEDGNKIIGENEVIIRTDNDVEIYSDYAEYFKDKNYITASGNVKIIDKLKNVLIKTDFVEYIANERILTTKGLTTGEIEDKYFIKSKDITYKLNDKIISSKNKSEIDLYDKNFLNINNIIYQINTQLVSGENLEFFDAFQNKFFIEKGIYDLNKKSLLGKDVKGYFNNEAFGNVKNEPRVSGLKISSNKKETKIKKGIFTTCKKRDGCPPWTLKASEVRHDKINKTINYKNAWLSIYDIPVLYFPKFFHPDPTVKRQSGFLAPRLSSSNTFGSSVYLPYFYAIDMDKDLTIKPKLYEGKKFILQNEYRQVTKKSSSIFDFSFGKSDVNQLNDNKETKSHFFADSFVDLSLDDFETSSLKIKIQRTSDESYLKAYNLESPIITNNSTLDNTIEFNGSTEKSNLNVKASVYEDTSILKGSDKYEYIFPSFSYARFQDSDLFGGLNLTLQSIGSQRKYDTSSEEGKLTNSVLINKKLFSNFGFKNELSSVLKNVNSNYKIGSDNQSKVRLLSETMFKSSLPLKKVSKNYKSILIPSLSIRFSPNKTDNIIEDDKTIDIDNIFLLNRLGENEIVEEGQSLIVGNKFKLINKNDRELFSFDLATNFRDSYAKDLPKKSTINKKSSDLFGKANVNFTDNFNLNYKFAVDNDYKTINYNFIEAELSINNFVTSFQFLEEGEIKGGSSYLANQTEYKFDERNSLLFRTRENKKKDLTEFYDLIYQYKIDCLAASLEYKKEYYSDEDLKPNESIFFTITIVPFQDFQTQNLKD